MPRLFSNLFEALPAWGFVLYRRLNLVILLTAPLWMSAIVFPLALFFVPGPHDSDRLVRLERGKNLIKISSRLKARGVLHSGTIFRLAARLSFTTRELHAGEYEFAARANMWTIINKLIRGEVKLHKVKIIEGASRAMIVEQLNANRALSGTINFTPEEGSLLPETYHVPRNTHRRELIHLMQTAMDEEITKLWAARLPGLPFETPREAIILASIVEKETALDEERGLVAAVFINRLQARMRLQSDPTIVYGMRFGQPLERALNRRDIAKYSPYNTYLNNGLPPTPISNPGRAALAAVLNPPFFEALYFVADGKGGHVFSKTLAEHNSHVAKLRRLRHFSARRRARK